MNQIRHKYYRREIIGSLWMTVMLIALGSIITDGGILGTIFIIAIISFWLGAILPLKRKEKKKSDRIYLGYGLIGLIFITFIIAPLVWNYRIPS